MNKLEDALIGKRVMAFIIDWIPIVLISIALFSVGPRFNVDYLLSPSIKMFSAYGVILAVIFMIVAPLTKDLWFGGVSLGKKICGLRVIDRKTLEKACTWKLIVRNITFYCYFFEAIVILFVTKDLTIGDILAGTIVARDYSR